MNKRMTWAAALLAAVTGSAAYAQPANDTICNATDISTQVGSVDFATADATLATNDADTTCNAGANTQTRNGVWWFFNSATRTNIRVFEPAANDVVIAVFSGADCNSATQVALPAQACSDSQDVIFTAEPNTNYWILVGMWSDTTNPTAGGYLTTIATFPVAANDVCAGATDVTSSLPFSATTDQRSFTTDVDVSCNSGTVGTAHGQWFTFTAPAAGLFRINETSGIDAVMQAYAACGGSLVGTCVDFAPETISINTTMGTQYWILIGRFTAPSSPAFFQQSGFSNPTTASYTVTATFSVAPMNDTACTAEPIASLPFSQNIDAAAALNDLDMGTCNAGASTFAGVWYTYTTGVSPERITITEANTAVNVVFQAYTGPCATPVSVSGTTCIDSTSTLDVASYDLLASTTYYFLIGNQASAVPAGNYDLSFVASPVAANDLVCNATDLNAVSFPFVDTVNNIGGTFDSDPSCNSSVTSGWNGIWYEYLSGPTSEILSVSEGGVADVNLSLWTGTLVCPGGTGLTQVVSGGCTDTDTGGSFNLAANTQYYVLVAHSPSSFPGAAYATTFNVVGIPANDACGNAASVASLPFGPTTIDARLAAAEGDVTCNTHTSAIASVWYTYTPASNETIICNETSSQDVVWTVFTACGGAEVGCSANDLTTFSLTGMTTYYIQLAMQGSTLPTGAYTFTIANPSAPNDDVCSAINLNTAGLPGSSYSQSVNTTALTDEVATASCDGPTTARQGVWYVYTTGATAETLAITETGTPDTINAVFTGTLVCPAGTGLTQVSGFCNDAGTTDNGTYLLNPNTQYYILISYFFSTGFPSGTYEVGFTSTVIPAPANDACADAEALSIPGTYSVDIRSAGDDADVTCNAAANTSFRRAIWYSYTPADSGTLFFNETSTNDVDFVIYTGTCGSLTEVYCNTLEPGTFNVTGGTPYFIAVGLDSATANPTVNLALTFDFVIPPDNDDCESPEAWSTAGGTVSPDGRVAGNDPDVTCNTGSATSAFAGVWYSFSSPDDNGRLRISETSANDVVIVVYEGAACGALTQITCSDPETNIDTPITAGTNYFVMIARFAASAPTAAYGITYSFIPNTGACCQSGGVCTSISNSACDAISGATYQGDNVSCNGAFVGGTEFNTGTTLPVTILDNATANATVVIAGSGVTLDANGIAVKLGLTHTFVGDLEISISNGTGSQVIMTDVNTSDASEVFGDYLFYDGAPSFVAAAAATATDVDIPTGSYAPSNGNVDVTFGSVFNGQPLDGTWTLTIFDDAGLDTGALTSFSVRQATFGAGPCPTGPTPCEQADFDDSGSVSVNDLFAFLAAWFAQNNTSGMGLSADIDGNDAVSVNDLFAFLALWFQFNNTSC